MKHINRDDGPPAFSGEAQLVTANGHRVVMEMHPDEVNQFLNYRPGTRFMIAAAPIDDPLTVEMDQWIAEGKAALRMAMASDPVAGSNAICRSEAFCHWAAENGLDPADHIKVFCGIESRSELKENRQARVLWEYMLTRFARYLEQKKAPH